MQSILWWVTGISLAAAGLAVWRERRIANREDLDKVGLVPWAFVLMIALFVAAVSAALAIKTG